MKITIDTKEDSHSEIRKAIDLLNTLIGETRTNAPSNIFEEPKTESGGNVFSMFDSPSESKPEVYGEEEKKEDDDPILPIMEY